MDEPEEKDFAFATMSLGGFNGTKAGATCETAEQLFDAWISFQRRKGRSYDRLTTAQWDRLIAQCGNIMHHREGGPAEGVDSSYWREVRKRQS